MADRAPLKVLYVGSVHHAELSMYREMEHNPSFLGCFLGRVGIPDVFSVVHSAEIAPEGTIIKEVKRQFKPHITLVRNRTDFSKYVDTSDIFWFQELYVLRNDGHRYRENDIPESAGYVACLSKPLAEKKGWLWLPYGVSKFHERPSGIRDIPVLVATNLPGVYCGGGMKRGSIDMLVKPIVEWDPKLIHIYMGFHGGLEKIPYIRPHIRKHFSPLRSTEMIARAKIWLSPTTIWNDDGFVSHKTIQGMACRTLTITNKYVGMEDLLGPDGQNLLYANSPEETLDKVKFYLSHDTERERIAKRGYEFIHNEFNWEKLLFNLYDQLKERDEQFSE